jgi:putative transposase
MTLVFLDESGFGLVPNVKRTWAPRGRTPHCPVTLKSGKVNAIGAVVVSAHQRRISLYVRLRKRSIRSPQVKCFLAEVLRRHRGPLMLLYDHSKTHTCQLVQTFLDAHPRVRREPFPKYAPELNPVEQVWTYLDAALANAAPASVAQLTAKLRRTVAKLQASQALLWASIFASDLPWSH